MRFPGCNDTTVLEAEHEVHGLDEPSGCCSRRECGHPRAACRRNETLLVWGNALLVLDLALHIVDGVRGLDLEGDGLARQGLNEAVAKSALVPVPSFIRMRKSFAVA